MRELLMGVHWPCAAALGLVFIALGGCGTTGGGISPVTSGVPSAAAAATRKPAAAIRIDAGADGSFGEAAVRAARESGLFGGVGRDGSLSEPPDLKIVLKFDSVRPQISDTETIWAATTIILFTVYPSVCARDEYLLVADVLDREGKLQKSYNLRETDTSYMWLFQADNCGARPQPERVVKMANGLLTKLFQEMARDGIAQNASSADAMQAGRKRLHISANRAGDIVERVSKASGPAAEMTFAEGEAGSADYAIRFDLDVSYSRFVTSRGFAGILTIGMVSPCEDTVFTLKAKVADRSGRQIWAHEASESYRTSTGGSGGACEILDERTRPEAVAELIRAAYARLRQERVISAAP